MFLGGKNTQTRKTFVWILNTVFCCPAQQKKCLNFLLLCFLWSTQGSGGGGGGGGGALNLALCFGGFFHHFFFSRKDLQFHVNCLLGKFLPESNTVCCSWDWNFKGWHYFQNLINTFSWMKRNKHENCSFEFQIVYFSTVLQTKKKKLSNRNIMTN